MAVDNPAPILRAIPKAKHLILKGKNIVAVKHTLDTARVLSNLGLDAPSPVLHGDYDFPGRYTPKPKQLSTVDFFTKYNRAYCFNEMRTGKTSAALWAADYLKRKGEVKRVLVVSPLTVMEVWTNEGFAVLPHRSVVELVGSKEKRIELAKQDSDFCVINFDGLRSLYHEETYPNSRRVKRRWSDLEGIFDLIIVDEADAYCNATNIRWKALNQLIKPETKVWLLTGTPINNAPTDAYGLLRLIQSGKVPPSFKLFEETLMKSVGPYKKVPLPGAVDTVFELMQPAVRFTREESAFPTTYQNRHAVMSKEQEKVFADLKEKMAHETEEVEITAQNAAVKLIKLQQIMCGVVKDDDGQTVELAPKNRLEVLERLVVEAGAKAVVFVPFIGAMHLVQNYLTSKGISSEIINGEVPKPQRKEILNRFKKNLEPRVLIAHPKVAAHGLDLTVADTFIWYAPTFSVSQYAQANARGEGHNKSMPVGIYHIACHPVEWRIYEVLKGKMNLQDELLNLYDAVLS